MKRPFPAALAALSVVLFLLPLAAHSPGQPPVLKSDEPAYYLAALSLAKDGDLRVDLGDRLRLFEEFPYLPVQNVIVSSDDGWRTLYFGKPYLYSMFAAPFAAIWGYRGMVSFNMLLLVGMIWMAAFWLRRHNPAWLADTFAAFFFVASAAWVYVYWIHPEIFNMFSGAACLFFGLRAAEARAEGHTGFWASPWPLVISASALAGGGYNKPMLAALGLPVIFELLRGKRWSGFATWLTASVVSISVFALGSVALTGQPTAYLVDLRAGFPVHNPHQMMVAPRPEPVAPPPPEAQDGVPGEEKDERSAGWWWILEKPHVELFEVLDDVPYFLFGRHTGLFVYQPFALLSIALFLAHGRRRFAGWSTLVSTFLIGAFFVVFIPFNWHGGGGFVGNRYFVMAYPAFLYLVTKISPAWPLAAFGAIAGLFVGPLVLAPHGLAVPQPTLQSHVRNAGFAALPLEHGIAEIPGYHGQVQADLWLWGRKDQIRPVEEELWILGGDPVELWVKSNAPVERLELELRSPSEGNRARLRLGDETVEEILGTEPTRIVFEPQDPTEWRRDRRRDNYQVFHDISIYLIEIELERGRLPSWRGAPGPRFYAGASLRVVSADRRTGSADVAE